MKSSTETNIFQLDTGTVQELFQKDIIKNNRLDSEDDFDKQILHDNNGLHSSYSLISIETEELYDDGLYVNVSTLLKPEGGYSVDDYYDRENITRFGLETIVEEMHDQTEDAVVESGRELGEPKSGLFYEEYEIDLRGQTSEELHQSEEFQRLLTLLSKPKSVTDVPIPVPSKVSNSEKGPDILIETTTNRKVECTLKEVKNTKYYLKGDGRVGSGMIGAEGVPSEADCRNYEVKGNENPLECPRIEQSCMSRTKCDSLETFQSECVKPKKSNGKSKSGKSEKRHGGSSKKCSKSSDKNREGWAAKPNLTNVTNVMYNKVKGILLFIQPKPSSSGNRDIFSTIGKVILNVRNLRNALASLLFVIIGLILVGALFYKPPGVVDILLIQLGRRRSPFQSFYDAILTFIFGLIK